MGYEELFEVKTMIKFGILGILLVGLVIYVVDGLKWTILLSLSGLIGLALALSGATIGKSHGPGGRR